MKIKKTQKDNQNILFIIQIYSNNFLVNTWCCWTTKVMHRKSCVIKLTNEYTRKIKGNHTMSSMVPQKIKKLKQNLRTKKNKKTSISDLSCTVLNSNLHYNQPMTIRFSCIRIVKPQKYPKFHENCT